MHQLRFMIVEDHEFQRTLLEHALRSLGAREVLHATKGDEAIRILRQSRVPVDIVITDLMMPDVDGIELLPMLRTVAPEIALILASTAEPLLLAAAELATTAHGIAVLGTIVKPITPAKLKPLLEAYLQQHPAQR